MPLSGFRPQLADLLLDEAPELLCPVVLLPVLEEVLPFVLLPFEELELPEVEELPFEEEELLPLVDELLLSVEESLFVRVEDFFEELLPDEVFFRFDELLELLFLADWDCEVDVPDEDLLELFPLEHAAMDNAIIHTIPRERQRFA